MKEVIIVDYGIGNLLSVSRALNAVGAKAIISSDHDKIMNADRLILPGVGAFGHCMHEIKQRELQDPILEFAKKQKPLLGICVGMQVLHSLGKEFGDHEGLGLIEGEVVPIAKTTPQGTVHKIPYVGWAKVKVKEDAIDHKLANSLHNKWFYFLHSFMAKPTFDSNIIAYYEYNGLKIVACTAKDHIMGLQCHPEKSADSGRVLLNQFLSI